MPYRLDTVIPLGRSYAEYVDMFALTSATTSGRILGCADGPAGFNAAHTRTGGSVVSLDPLYQYAAGEIQNQIDKTFPEAMHQVSANHSEFVWDNFRDVEHLSEVRMDAMRTFLDDFSEGRNCGRYIAGGLPELPFSDRAFDLALCSHYLFLYSEQLSREFHIHSIGELCRVADEVRIFPLLELGSVDSRHLGAVLDALENMDLEFEVQQVSYEFQRGGNRMLKVSRR